MVIEGKTQRTKNAKGNFRNKNSEPQVARRTPRHLKNYYETIVDIAEDLGSISFVLFGPKSKETLVRITKEGITKDDEAFPMKANEAWAFIMARESAFNSLVEELLQKKNLYTKYIPVIRLAMIADEAELIGANVTYKFYDNGMNKELEISPGRENMVYKYMGKENKIGVARAAVIKYYPEFLIQTQKALQNACLLRDKASGKLEAEETAKAREKLGIRVREKDGRVYVDADSILKRATSPNKPKEVAKNTQTNPLLKPASRMQNGISSGEKMTKAQAAAAVAFEEVFKRKPKAGYLK
jgi:hypothetical protein|nr:MAG TPA: hypothetical protein [Caudoviricetes sp.]